ncbi:Origin recognition complex, subunit 1 [Coemansia sp. Benny D115]|nr:Origin recognition complex, subunit 1 [Coemansia sp. Benny D115]
MSEKIQLSRAANRLTNAAAKQARLNSRRKQHVANDSDSDDAEDIVEWGQRLHQGTSQSADTATRSTRRVTRQSGMTNKELYKSVIVNGTEYQLGQTVKVRSSEINNPHLATIYKLWENEKGEKQVVARWLLRKHEIYLGEKTAGIDARDDEVFYSNADDLISPDMILAPLEVLSYKTYESQKSQSAKKNSVKRWFCSRYFNEQTAVVGDLDWDEFYNSGGILDESLDAEMFKKVQKKPLGKEAATKAGRAKVAARRAQANAKAPRKVPAKGRATKRRRKTLLGHDDMDHEDAQSDSSDMSVDIEDEEDFVPAKAPARRAATPSAKAATGRSRRATLAAGSIKELATPTKRRMRLQDIQPAAVSATMLKRATRVGKNASERDTDGLNIYEMARMRLHVSAVPDTLPCREDEFAEIYGSLYNAIEERNSMCLYISGVPGTGKTATVHEVIRSLQENAEEGELPEFKYIELNGMKMTEPSQAYTQLWQAITGDKVTPKHAAQLLEQHFSTPSPRRHTYVVLMDELDLLVTKSQSIMYNFFDWPHRPHAKLVVIAIANTMDLPERMLHHKVSSRLGLTRINFQPYTHQQLMSIVQSRLEGCMAFDSDAVELCARKISAVSGDARRALDVCRRAVEIVESEWVRQSAQPGHVGKQILVNMLVIDRAVKEMYASGHIAFIQNASLQQKVFLVALRAAIRKAGIPEVSLGDVTFIHRQLCQLHEITIPSYEQVAKVCSQLGATRCILTESSMLDVHQQVRLAIADDDITVALRPDPLFQKISTS